MELTSMFLNQLSSKSNSSTINTYKSSTGFNEFLNKAESNFNNQKYNYNNSSYKNENNSSSYKKNTDNLYNKKTEIDKTEIDKTVQDKEVSKTDNKTVEKDNIIKDDESLDKEKVTIVDDETLNKLSEILGISKDKITEILSNLSISVSMLQNTENLIKFLQSAFEIENPTQLLSVDNIKETMTSIIDIAKNINYQDSITIDESINSTLNDLVNTGIFDEKVTILGSESEQLKQKINQLLNELNGNVKEVKTTNSLVENSNIKTNINSENIKLDENIEDLSNIDNSQQIKVKNIENTTYYQSDSQNNNQNNQGQMLLNNNQNVTLEANTEQGIFNISDITNNNKVFNTSLPKTQSLKNINSSDVVAQIMEKIKVSVKPEVSEVKILLRPEQLGEVSLKIATQNGIVTAQFIAESQKVKEIIEANFNQLRDMLAEQGVNVGELEVNVSSNNKEENQYNSFEQEQQQNNKRIENIIKESFEQEQEEQKNNITQEEIIESQVNYSI